MNMRLAKYAFAVLAGAILAGQAQGAELFFANTPTFASGAAATAASLVNPVFAIPQGTAGHIYLWAKLAAPAASGNAISEQINALGVDVVESGGDFAHGTAYSMSNNDPNTADPDVRFDTPVNSGGLNQPGPVTTGGESVGHPILASMRRGAVSTLGLANRRTAAALGDHDAANIIGSDGSLYQLVNDITVTGDTAGSVPLFLKTNTFTIGYAVGGPLINFGAGDAAVDPRAGTGGVTSSVADATLTVVGGGATPEPTSLALLGMVGVGLIRRRKA